MSKTDSPLVGILMGSDSDWPTLQAATDALAESGIANEALKKFKVKLTEESRAKDKNLS